MSSFPDPKDLIPHRPPFLYIDEVLLCDDKQVHAIKYFDEKMAFFEGHFPGNPIVPGVILLEGLAQSFAYMAMQHAPGSDVYLTGVDRARFKKIVKPNETVHFHVRLDDQRMGILYGRGDVKVGDSKVATAKFSGLVVPPKERSVGADDDA